MTGEQLEKGQKLINEARLLKAHLDVINTNRSIQIRVHDGRMTHSIEGSLSDSLQQTIKSIIRGSLEAQLADLNKQFEAL